ncbi:glucose-6-phosphate isomerase [Paracoccaceae bacterium GXU_MW_L88]
MTDALHTHWDEVKERRIAHLFDEDKDRFESFSVCHDGLLLDYSKTQIDARARDLLLKAAEAAGVAKTRDAMFSGEIINTTEGRAVLHTALRNLSGDPVMVDGADVMPGVLETLDKMADFADGIRSGEIAADDGQPFTDIVNIGIGGSDLGPAMAARALSPYADGPETHFVSNVDGAQIADVLAGLDPNRTLVIVSSKTFTTIETMTNAETAKSWLGGRNHFAAVSTAEEKTSAFGVSKDRVFGFEDWVGGRYSMWGPIGLSLMIAIGPENFRDFLGGAEAMDRHFREAEGADNMPLMLGLVGYWHATICGYPTRAILPYEERLGRLPAYLQQLDMESNGKSVQQDGSAAPSTGPIVWGEPGTNGQHAFYQLIHQGSHIIPCEFMVGAEGQEPELSHHHKLLVANCLAQSEALMLGRDFAEAEALMEAEGHRGDELERQARHRVFPGNRPSLTLIYDKMTPYVLGQIVALYEHRVFVEGVLWGINSFDQWGVELGKILAKKLEPLLGGGDLSTKDGSTAGLIEAIRQRS